MLDFKYEVPDTWVEVILPLALPVVYTYEVPARLKAEVKVGCRVEVVFGKNKKYAGIIKTILHKKPSFETKPILQVFDGDPLVFPLQLNFWNWLAQYYMCTEGEVMAAALPANFKLSSETIILFNEDAGEDFTQLSNSEYLVAEALLIRKQLTMKEVHDILDAQHVYPVVKQLIDKRICVIWEKMSEKIKPKKQKYVYLHPQYRDEAKLEALLNGFSGAPKQMELLLAFLYLEKKDGDVVQADLLGKAGASKAQLNALEQKGILQVEERTIDRLATLPKFVEIKQTLSEAQLAALADVKAVFQEKEVCLLHGVTGSGKTLIYVKLIEEVLASGKQVIYLVPEIALTSQLIRRLQVFFGGNIAVYHSRFNDQERVEIWNKIRNNETQIVLGARSALLLPFTNPGLIIVDEEHDPSYKQQDPAPRYNARDAAIYFGMLTGSKVLLGSATPSIESFHNARTDKYGYVLLKERYGDLLLPDVEIVNMATESKYEKAIIGERLAQAIDETIQKDKQVILFQNRRGYNPYLLCGTCGDIPKCKHCDVSLTLHKYSNKLHCHYCGSTYPRLVSCTACGSQNWKEKNFGTEKAEELLDTVFPDYKIARMDMDSVRGKTAHDNLVRQFESRQLDILIGTQMLVKGLDFDHVDLVGILDADGLLSFNDFRANERAFQLMEQVSGRAGRKNDRGKVLIQAIQVDHPVLRFVKEHDYNGMYEYETKNRKNFFYPPFNRIVQIKLKHINQQKVEGAANKLANILSKDMQVLGPAKPDISRIRNMYILEMMIKLQKGNSGEVLKKVIHSGIQLMHADKMYSPVLVVIDVDPI